MVSIWPKITQPYITLTVLEVFRNILARCGAIVRHQSYQSIFPKQIRFGQRATREKITQPYSHDLLCEDFFEMMQHVGHIVGSWTKVMSVKFSKNLPFGEVTWMQFGPMLCKLLSHEGFFETFQHERITVRNNINSQLCQKISFGTNEQFGLNLGQNYSTLHLMSDSKDLFDFLQSDGAYQIDKSNSS